jgi:DNA-binding CsgD family transcriptional regulator
MEESLVITREIEDYRFLSSRLSQLGLVILNEGNCAEVRPLLEESLAIAKEIEDRRYIADALGIMGLLYLNEKNYALAQVHFDESLALAREVGDRYLIGYRVADSGLLALHQKNGTKARPLIEEGLAASIEAGNRWFIASCLERMGEVAITQDQFLWATQLWGAAAAMRDAIGAPVPPIEQEFYEDVLAAARVQLGESAFLSAWKIGYTMTPEQVISSSIDESLFPDMHRTQLEQALPASLSVSTARSAPGPAHPFAALSVLKAFTRREIEVLQLLVQGASNREIADRLVISEGTVKKHVSNICGKLGVQSRTQVVARALSL